MGFISVFLVGIVLGYHDSISFCRSLNVTNVTATRKLLVFALVARLNQTMRSEKFITNILGYFFPKTLAYTFTTKKDMDTQTTVVIFAILAAFGLITVVAVDILLTAQEAEAQKPRGCNRSVAANASQGRCVEPGKP
jgi:hypothetical protein